MLQILVAADPRRHQRTNAVRTAPSPHGPALSPVLLLLLLVLPLLLSQHSAHAHVIIRSSLDRHAQAPEPATQPLPGTRSMPQQAVHQHGRGLRDTLPPTPPPTPSPSPSPASVVSTYVALTLQGITAEQLNDTAALLAYRKILAKYMIGTSYLGLKPAYERVNITLISDGSGSGRKLLYRTLRASSTTSVASSITMLSTSVQSGTTALADAYNGGGLLTDLNSGGIATSSLCCLQVNDQVFPTPGSASSPTSSPADPGSSPTDSADSPSSKKGLGVVAIGVICGVVAVVAVVALFGARVIIRNRSKEREGSKEQIVTDVVARAAKRHNWTNARVAMMQRLLGKRVSNGNKPTSPNQSNLSMDKELPSRSDDLSAAKESADQLTRVKSKPGYPLALLTASEAGGKDQTGRNTSGTSDAKSDVHVPRAKVMPLTPDVAEQWPRNDGTASDYSNERIVLDEQPQRPPSIHAGDPWHARRMRGESDAGGAGGVAVTALPFRSMPKRVSTGCPDVHLLSLPAGGPASPMGWPAELDGMRTRAFDHAPTSGIGSSPKSKRGVSMPGHEGLGNSPRSQPKAAFGTPEHEEEVSDLELVNHFLQQQRAAGSGTTGPVVLDQFGVVSSRNPMYESGDRSRASGTEPPGPSTLKQAPNRQSFEHSRAHEQQRMQWEAQQCQEQPPLTDLKALAAHLKSQRLKAGRNSGTPMSPKHSRQLKMMSGMPSRGSGNELAPNPNPSERSLHNPRASETHLSANQSASATAAAAAAAAAATVTTAAAAAAATTATVAAAPISAAATPNPTTPPGTSNAWGLLNLMSLLRGRRHGSEDTKPPNEVKFASMNTVSGIELETVESTAPSMKSRRSSYSCPDDRQAALAASPVSVDGMDRPKSRSVAWDIQPQPGL